MVRGIKTIGVFILIFCIQSCTRESKKNQEEYKATYFYRLKIINKDGTFTYSPVIRGTKLNFE